MLQGIVLLVIQKYMGNTSHCNAKNIALCTSYQTIVVVQGCITASCILCSKQADISFWQLSPRMPYFMISQKITLYRTLVYLLYLLANFNLYTTMSLSMTPFFPVLAFIPLFLSAPICSDWLPIPETCHAEVLMNVLRRGPDQQWWWWCDDDDDYDDYFDDYDDYDFDGYCQNHLVSQRATCCFAESGSALVNWELKVPEMKVVSMMLEENWQCVTMDDLLGFLDFGITWQSHNDFLRMLCSNHYHPLSLLFTSLSSIPP